MAPKQALPGIEAFFKKPADMTVEERKACAEKREFDASLISDEIVARKAERETGMTHYSVDSEAWVGSDSTRRADALNHVRMLGALRSQAYRERKKAQAEADPEELAPMQLEAPEPEIRELDPAH